MGLEEPVLALLAECTMEIVERGDCTYTEIAHPDGRRWWVKDDSYGDGFAAWGEGKVPASSEEE